MSTQMVGACVRFERIRRITGYLVGALDRFNNAKRAEERDRVKHARMMQPAQADTPQKEPPLSFNI